MSIRKNAARVKARIARENLRSFAALVDHIDRNYWRFALADQLAKMIDNGDGTITLQKPPRFVIRSQG